MRAERLRDVVVWTSVTVAVCGDRRARCPPASFRSKGDSWTLGAVAIGYCAFGWLWSVGSRSCRSAGCCSSAGRSRPGRSWRHGGRGRSSSPEPDSLPVVGFAAWLSVWLSPLPWPLVLVAPAGAVSRRPRAITALALVPVVVAAAVGALAVTTAIVATPVAARTSPNLVEAGVARSGRRAGDRPGRRSPDGRPVAPRSSRWPAWSTPGGGPAGSSGASTRSSWSASSVVIVNSARRRARTSPVTTSVLDAPEALDALALLAISVAIAVAIVRYRLYNLGLLVSRTVLVRPCRLLPAAVYTAVLVVLAGVLDESTACPYRASLPPVRSWSPPHRSCRGQRT